MQIGSSILSTLKERKDIWASSGPASSPPSLSEAFSSSIHSFVHSYTSQKRWVSPFGELIRLAPTNEEARSLDFQ